VTSIKDRQRAAARARLEREMITRQEQAGRRRQRRTWSALSAVAVVVVAGLVVLLVQVTNDPTTKPVAVATLGPANCKWAPNPAPAASASPGASAPPSTPPNPDLKKTGLPPATDLPHAGTRDMVMNTSQGNITISLDVAKAPCAAESFSYLAGKKFFDGTSCDELVTTGPYALLCGDPSGKGDGGPSYTFPAENLPTDQRPNYPAGVVAMYVPIATDPTTGQPAPAQNLNGSQFLIVYKDTPVSTDPSTGTETSALPSGYTIIGTITGGMDLVQKIAAAGTKTADPTTGATAPKLPVNIKTLTVSDVKTS
jgi:peptidyl-prolyl cis-trans isomerase B (cyclophilin B)